MYNQTPQFKNKEELEMTLKKSYVQSNMMRQWDLISTCVPHSWVVFLENSCQNFLFVLLNEIGVGGGRAVLYLAAKQEAI